MISHRFSFFRHLHLPVGECDFDASGKPRIVQNRKFREAPAKNRTAQPRFLFSGERIPVQQVCRPRGRSIDITSPSRVDRKPSPAPPSMYHARTVIENFLGKDPVPTAGMCHALTIMEKIHGYVFRLGNTALPRIDSFPATGKYDSISEVNHSKRLMGAKRNLNEPRASYRPGLSIANTRHTQRNANDRSVMGKTLSFKSV